MNGGNTVPTRRAPTFLNATEVGVSTPVAGANSTPSTPPPVRRSKLAINIGRLLRPWKWRRRKKSQKFITTSQNLERQLSVRTNRDELIKKGILPVTTEDKENENDSADIQCNGPLHTKKVSDDSDEKHTTTGQPGSNQQTPLSQRGNLPTENEVKNDFQVQQLDTMSMMDQLARELARRNTGSSSDERTVLKTQNNRHCSTSGQQPRFFVVQSSSKENSREEHFHDESTLQKDDGPDSSFSDSDEEEETQGIVTGLASKLKRKDSLALKLRARPSQSELEARNILPTKTEEEKLERKNEVGTKLIRRLSTRPSAQELRERNILKSSSEEEAKEEKEEKKRVLTRKLSRRPTVQELRAKKILKFNDYVECVDVHDYDRRADKPWTRLTPEDKAAIRKELNEFKSKEMEVHEESKQYTRFHRP